MGWPLWFYTQILRGVVKNFWAWISLPMYFGQKKFTGFSNRLLLVLLKNSCRLLVYFTRYNVLKIAGCTVRRILTKYAIVRSHRLQNFWHWRTFSRSRYTNVAVVYGQDVLSYPMVTRCAAEKKPSRRALVGTPMRSCLWRKLSCCWKYCIAESSLPHLEVMRGFQSLGVTVLVCLSVYQSAVLQKKL